MKELIEEKKFEMRAYDKVELALLYCPGRSAESALKTLMRWIKQCQPLMQALGGIGYNVRRHRFPASGGGTDCPSFGRAFEKERMKFFISAAVHTSTSGFQYIIQQIVVLLFLSSCICLSSFFVLVSGTFLNSVVTSMYVFYTNLSGVFRYCHLPTAT